MKSFFDIDAEERGLLLAQWFPEEKITFLEFAKNYCTSILKGKDMTAVKLSGHTRTKWEWKEIATKTIEDIERNLPIYKQSPKKFAQVYFNYYGLLYTIHLLKEYISQKSGPTPEFKLAAQLFFLL